MSMNQKISLFLYFFNGGVVEICKKYKIFWNENNVNNKIIHVRAIVDGDQVVYKEYWKSKKRWVYFVKEMQWFDMLKEKGVIEMKK